MLVLTRKPEQDQRSTIVIADGLIKIHILKLRHDGSIVVGIDAPRDIQVDRGEVFARKEKEAPAA